MGFRRDVRWFLALLVGFLVVILLVLLLLLGDAVERAEEAERSRWKGLSTAAADRIGDTARSELPTILISLRSRLGIEAVHVRFPDGSTISSGTLGDHLERVERRAGDATAILYFDATPLQNAQRGFLLTAALVLASTVGGLILLLLYVPRILRPIEQMLDHARELEIRDESVAEDHYLIETFRRSIETLKRQEEELKHLHGLEKARADELERVTATLTRSLISGFIALDPEGRVVDLNRSAREILGLGPEVANRLRVTGEPGPGLEQLLGSRPFEAILGDAFERRAAVSRQEIVEASRMIGLTTVPLIDESDRFLGMLALFTDLTPVRQLEARVREMQALADLGEISAGIAHEFRNSLSTILGYLKLAKRQSELGSAVERISKAEAEAAQLAASIEGLLGFARPVELEREPVDLEELAASVVESLRGESSGIDVEIVGSGVTVAADPHLLRRAIENIVRNAVEAIRLREPAEGGTIRIRIRREPVTGIEIHDNGIGFEPRESSRLFLPFQSDKPQGLGLGLALARKIVLLHGGQIRITGEKGRGASVVIDLGAEAAEPEAARPEPRPTVTIGNSPEQPG